MFWSKRSTCSGLRPCRAATSAEEGDQAYGLKSAGRGFGLNRPLSACGMARQPLHTRERQRDLPRAVERVRPHELDRLQEALEPEAAGALRETARRQHVRGPGGVVADDGRRSHEHRSRVPHARRDRLGVGEPQLEVLWRVVLRAGERLVDVRHALDADVRLAGDERDDVGGQRRRGAKRIASLSGPCSAWASRSAAHWPASAVASAIRTTSLGPAGRSIAHALETSSLAAVTHWLPGPTILSTGSIVSVPYASAATACAPPTAYTSSMPSSRATASVASAGRGVTTAIRPTPATRAGTAAITSDDG